MHHKVVRSLHNSPSRTQQDFNEVAGECITCINALFYAVTAVSKIAVLIGFNGEIFVLNMPRGSYIVYYRLIMGSEVQQNSIQ